MKNPSKFALELAVTVVVAFLLSLVLSLILTFAIGNSSFNGNWPMIVNSVSSVVFGLIIGFKLNDLLRQHKK